MRRRITALLATGLLGGCIPQVAEPPMRAPPYRPPAAPIRNDLPPPPPRDDIRNDAHRNEDHQRDASPPDDMPREAASTRFTAPGERPTWERASVQPDATTIAPGTYTVRPGDTLRSIADRVGSASPVIARANGLPPPFAVRVGQVLRIPGGRYHLVRAGQTGIGIARAYGVEWPAIIAANDLSEPFILRNGQRLLIPGEDRPRTAAERAAAFTLDIDTILTGGEPAIAETASPAAPARIGKPVPRTDAIAPPAHFAGGFDWPVEGPVLARFGAGANGIRNNGMKIAVPLGTPVKAAADGTVAYVGDDVPGLGGLVMILHGNGWTSVYGHTRRVLVSRGEAVKRGQTIAISGDTGSADRPELHFELRKGRAPVDPLSQLPPR